MVDDTTALSNWIAAVNASTEASVYAVFGPGDCQLSSIFLSTGLVVARSNVTIDGQGAKITVTGASLMKQVFSSSDQSHIHYKNINLIGNSVATDFALGGAIGFTNASADITDLLVEDCTFTNFKGDYWIYIQTLGGFSNSIQNININRNYFLSANGNARGPTNIGINSSFVLVYGVGNNGGPLTPNSFVRSVRVTNNVMRADYIKVGIQVFENVQDVLIFGNQIYNSGLLGGITDDKGSYAMMVYEGGSPYSKHAIIENNYIFNARDNCLYMAGRWTNSVVNANVCDTQLSTATATLPKGGFSFNGSIGTTITNNRAVSIAGDGITLVAPAVSTNGDWLIANNYINAGLSGVRLLNSGGNATGVMVVNNTILNFSTAVGVFLRAHPGASYTDLKVDDNKITAGTYSIWFMPDSGTLTLTNVSVSRNLSRGATSSGIDVSQVVAGGPVLVHGNVVSGAPTKASFDITSTLNLVAQDNVVSGQNVGVGWTTAGAQGTLRNNSFDRTPVANIVATLGPTDLGRAIPAWIPASSGGMSVVQVLNTSEQGASPNKFLLREWVYSAASGVWLEQRMFTGN
ncbi:hypothetical protein LMTR3_07910 [Bradyrhizobium sp. LMTR 3]|nr:hypothetical protein LMTR3_07910 [Bradyrhizobium sp. LMTR 3]